MLAPALLHIDRLEKSFDGRSVLAISECEVQRGQAYVLTGMNGVGKSVFLRILAGLEQPNHCRLAFDSNTHDLRRFPRVMRENIVYVHQHPVMLRMTVAQNIAYGLRLRHVNAEEIHARVETAMRWAGVAHLQARMPQGLSGGEKQRIALARAKIIGAPLLLLDEPTANLDGQAREQVLALIPDLIASSQSVVMACHDRDLIHLPGVVHWKLRDGRIEVRNEMKEPHHVKFSQS